MKRIDVLRLLSRNDKHYLGGGNRLLWAPPFPLFLECPGFWDKAHYYNYEIQPLFTWTILDDDGQEIPLQYSSRTWDPSCLVQIFTGKNRGSRVTVREEKSLLPNDTAICRALIRTNSRKQMRLHFIAWTVQESYASKQAGRLSAIILRKGIVSCKKHLQQADRPELDCGLAMGLSRRVCSSSINISEGSIGPPQWRLTPFHEKFSHGRLPGDLKPGGVTDEGLIYIALHTEIVIPPGREESVDVGLAAARTVEEARLNLRPVLGATNPVEFSKLRWIDHFSGVPYFVCSDDYLTRYYWYRWYGLRLNSMEGEEGNYQRPFVCEGIGYFRAPISYSAVCHMLENRWRHDPDLARGSLLTFIDNQRSDGGFRGYIDVHHYRQEMFYHANWGHALEQLHRVHPSENYLAEVYDGLKRYVSYFDKERDEEVSGLYDIDNHYETGQEFMHRYIAVDPNADRDNWGKVFRLKGVDVTVYLYELKRAMSTIAASLNKPEDAELWDIEAGKIKSAVLTAMWDPAEEMFFDVDPATGQRTMVKAATCFYPYFTDIVSKEHVPGLVSHLLNPKEFWTPYPVPSSSADDEFFSAEPEWKGKRMNCPWNGRVWPMTNSHIAEALACTALRFNDARLKRKAAEFISRTIRMMFFDGDPERPNCFEHYNPVNGKPSVYRGIDDYQHSWIVDLIITYACGIRPQQSGVTIDPLPFGLDHLFVDDVMIRGKKISVEIKKNHFTVRLNGNNAGKSSIGKPITLTL